MFVVPAISGAVAWEVARRAKKGASKPAEEALKELRDREKELRKELEVRELEANEQREKPFDRQRQREVVARARSLVRISRPEPSRSLKGDILGQLR